MLTVEITGLDAWQKALEPQAFNRACDRILDRGSQTWADETKKMPPVSAKTTGYDAKGMPVDSGRTRQSIHNRRISNIAAGVVAPVSYGEKIRFGTATMPGRDFFLFALEDFGAKQKIDGIVQEELSRDFGTTYIGIDDQSKAVQGIPFQWIGSVPGVSDSLSVYRPSRIHLPKRPPRNAKTLVVTRVMTLTVVRCHLMT